MSREHFPKGIGKENSQSHHPSHSIPTGMPTGDTSSSSESVNAYPAKSLIPKGDSQTPQLSIKSRPAAPYSLTEQAVFSDTPKHLANFFLTGSAYSYLSLLNSQQGIGGNFNIIFQPENGDQVIPLSEFHNKGNEKVLAAYEKVAASIEVNRQSIVYGLLQEMVVQQTMVC